MERRESESGRKRVHRADRVSAAVEYTLIAPGPTPLPPTVVEALRRPVIHHRTKEFSDAFALCLERLKAVSRTESRDPLLMTASGSGAMESAVSNLLSPGDKALVCESGIFGDRFIRILRAYGLDPIVVKSEWGRAIDPDKLKNTLMTCPGIKAVYLQHADTSTGILNDLPALSDVIRDHSDALIVVDAVSSLAAERLETDAWDLDVVLAGSQKGLMGPPGLAFALVSKHAWSAVEDAKLPRFYFDWKTMRECAPLRQTPYTPAVNAVLAQVEALRLILEEGLEAVWKRTAELASYTRGRVAERGWKLFAKDPSNILTGIVMPEGVDGKKLVEDILTEDGISIAGGQGPLAGKLVRLAHLGFIGRDDIDRGLAALDKRLPPADA